MTYYNYIRTPCKIQQYISEGLIKYRFSQLPEEYRQILIKVQDPGFYRHKGFDAETPGAGWTTVTQSLAKHFYFRKFKPGWRKIPQTAYARFALHPNMSKELQMDFFINISYYGKGKKGILPASEYYFKKRPEELDRDEFISLIAVLNSPNELNPEDNPEANRERVRKIKRYLKGDYTPEGVLDNWYKGA